MTKSYGRLTAVADVSLSIRKGEVLALIGPNGSGKTTLFECIAGLLPADRGRLTIDGQAVETAARGSHLFFMPDGMVPWPSETVGWALDFTIGFFGGVPARRTDVIGRLAALAASSGATSGRDLEEVVLALT